MNLPLPSYTEQAVNARLMTFADTPVPGLMFSYNRPVVTAISRPRDLDFFGSEDDSDVWPFSEQSSRTNLSLRDVVTVGLLAFGAAAILSAFFMRPRKRSSSKARRK